jgi:hypothetical protein
MANTFISTDPETKVQKTIKIPDGCTLIEMQEKEIYDLVMQITADFILNMGKRDQIFPKEVKSANEIWEYIYPIRRGVAGVLVNEDNWKKRVQGKNREDRKNEKERLCFEDIENTRIKYDEARIFYLASKGVMTSIAMDYLYPQFKREKDYGENELCEIIIRNIANECDIDLSAAKKELIKARKQYFFYHLEFPINEDQHNKLLNHAILALRNTLDRKPVNKQIKGYLDTFKEIKVDCYKLMEKIYRENGDFDKLRKIRKEIIFDFEARCTSNTPYSISRFIGSNIREYGYQLVEDEKEKVKNEILQRHPKVAEYYLWGYERTKEYEEQENIPLLKQKLTDCYFSARVNDCLKSRGIETLGDLIDYQKSDLMKIRGLGSKALNEIEDYLAIFGLQLGLGKKLSEEEKDIYGTDKAPLRITNLTSINLSLRTIKCLNDAKIFILGDLMAYSKSDLLKLRNIGKKTVEEIETILASKGLEFGMDISSIHCFNTEITKNKVTGNRIEDAKMAELYGHTSEAAEIYEFLIKNDNKDTESYKRLMVIYRKWEMYDDEIRVIKIALANCTDNTKLIEEWKERLEKAKELKYKAYIKSLQKFE